MAATLKYQGREQSRNKDSQLYKQTWQGTQKQIDGVIAQLPLIGAFITGKGYMTSYRKTCDEGPYWQLEVEYTIQYSSSSSSFDNSADTVIGKKSAQLSARSIQMPLQKHEKYLVNWNYFLVGKDGSTVPSWWSTLKNIDDSSQDFENYKWVKSTADIPEVGRDGKAWKLLKKPTKPGVEYYDLTIFVITILEKYRSATAAGNAIKKNINRVIEPEEDFNLGGQWKYDDASVIYDGKNWIATSTYSRADLFLLFYYH